MTGGSSAMNNASHIIIDFLTELGLQGYSGRLVEDLQLTSLEDVLQALRSDSVGITGLLGTQSPRRHRAALEKGLERWSRTRRLSKKAAAAATRKQTLTTPIRAAPTIPLPPCCPLSSGGHTIHTGAASWMEQLLFTDEKRKSIRRHREIIDVDGLDSTGSSPESASKKRRRRQSLEDTTNISSSTANGSHERDSGLHMSSGSYGMMSQIGGLCDDDTACPTTKSMFVENWTLCTDECKPYPRMSEPRAPIPAADELLLPKESISAVKSDRFATPPEKEVGSDRDNGKLMPDVDTEQAQQPTTHQESDNDSLDLLESETGLKPIRYSTAAVAALPSSSRKQSSPPTVAAAGVPQEWLEGFGLEALESQRCGVDDSCSGSVGLLHVEDEMMPPADPYGCDWNELNDLPFGLGDGGEAEGQPHHQPSSLRDAEVEAADDDSNLFSPPGFLVDVQRSSDKDVKVFLQSPIFPVGPCIEFDELDRQQLYESSLLPVNDPAVYKRLEQEQLDTHTQIASVRQQFRDVVAPYFFHRLPSFAAAGGEGLPSHRVTARDLMQFCKGFSPEEQVSEDACRAEERREIVCSVIAALAGQTIDRMEEMTDVTGNGGTASQSHSQPCIQLFSSTSSELSLYERMLLFLPVDVNRMADVVKQQFPHISLACLERLVEEGGVARTARNRGPASAAPSRSVSPMTSSQCSQGRSVSPFNGSVSSQTDFTRQYFASQTLRH